MFFFGALEGVCSLIGLAAEGIAGLAHLSSKSRDERRKGSLAAGIAAIFTLVAVVGVVGYLVYDNYYNPTKSTRMLIDNIALNMSNEDPFKEDGPDVHVLEKDNWGNPIVYSRSIDEEDSDVVLHVVQSCGADGIINTEDDLFAESKSQSLVKSVGKSVGRGIKDLAKGLWNGIWD